MKAFSGSVLLIAFALLTNVTQAVTPTTAPATTQAVAPIPFLSPEEELRTFQLPPGVRAEIVATEPMVEHPVYITFDPRGRMWVAEMRGYMPDVSGWGENRPTGRVSVLEDTDGDGRMDRKTIFADKLVLPRAIGFVKDGVLIISPPKLLLYRDVDGDLKADEQCVVATNWGVVDNPENYANGMLWGLDNWIYNADHDQRIRYREGKLIVAPLPVMGQWGITRDDDGRMFFNTNSDYLRGALIPPHYATRNPKSSIALADTRVAKDQTVWPIRASTVNRGYRPGFLQPDGKLKEFTAACSPMIYRGNLFPDYYGNAFACEATSNFVRRSVIHEANAILTADAAVKGKEFLASTDERFRPVTLQTGPDGAIYVVDMHHGLIQHRISLTQYGKQQYLTKKLDKPLLKGRIFRIVPDGGAPVPHPRLDEATTAQLVGQLSHPAGWWRDTAQRLLVERSDPHATPLLRKVAAGGKSPVHRINALWTLDGMGQISVADVKAALAETDVRVRTQAVRLAERFLIGATAPEMLKSLAMLPGNDVVSVKLQLALTLAGVRSDEADQALVTLLKTSGQDGNIRQAAISGIAGREIRFAERLLEGSKRSPAMEASLSDVARSLARRENPREMLELVQLIASQTKVWQQAALLAAIPSATHDDFGSLKLFEVAEKPAAIDALASSNAEPVRASAAKVAALFQWPGKPLPPRPKVEPLTPRQQELFEIGRVQYATICAQCHKPDGTGQEGKAPPLLNSPWALGPDKRAIRIVLHGLRGPVTVHDRTFNLDMPSLAALSDDQVAGVLTYIRREWGHEAPAVDPATVQSIRDWSQARRDGWTVEELLQIR